MNNMDRVFETFMESAWESINLALSNPEAIMETDEYKRMLAMAEERDNEEI